MAKFLLGTVYATPGALRLLTAASIHRALGRHLLGDWGDVCAADVRANNHALIDGTRLLSVYAHEGTRFWIITEADRSATTILFPEEY